jgi:hypothetical protein
MPDAVITPSSVVQGSGAQTTASFAGETITAGQIVYRHTDGLVYKTDADASVQSRALLGIALNGGALNQPILVQTTGQVNLGSGLLQGRVYVASATPGGFAPAADLVVGWASLLVGVALSTAVLDLRIYDPGIDVA